MDLSQHQESFDKLYKSHPLVRGGPGEGLDEHGLRSSFQRYIWRRTFDNIVALLRLENVDNMLNIGVGFGSDEKVLKARFPEVELYGVDIAPSLIKHAVKALSPCHLAVAAAEELPLPDNAFQRVVSREVIEHVLDVGLYLQQIRRVTLPGSIAVVTTPNGGSGAFGHVLERVGLDFLLESGAYKDDHLSTGSLESSFKEAGFQKWERYFDCPGYFWLGALKATPLGFLAHGLARVLRCLEGDGWLSALFCDQVKYALVNEKEGEVEADSVVEWVCPRCRSKLSEVEEGLRCAGCGEVYELLDGEAPVFLRQSVPPGPSSPSGQGSRREKARPVRRAAYIALFLLYSIFYVPLLLLGAATAAVLNGAGRVSRPGRRDLGVSQGTGRREETSS